MSNSAWAVVVAAAAAAEVVFDLFWEILARFAPGSGTLFEP